MKQITAVDLVEKIDLVGQTGAVAGQQQTKVFVVGVVKEEADPARRSVKGVDHFVQHRSENFGGKGIEKVQAGLFFQRILLSRLTEKADAGSPAIGGCVFHRLLVDRFVVLDAGRTASEGVVQKEGDPSFAAAVVEQVIVRGDPAAFRQPLQNAVGGWLVGMMVRVGMGGIPPDGMDMQFVVPA